MKIKSLLCAIMCIATQECTGAAEYYSSGSPDIDRVRVAVKESPTTAENYWERSLLLFVWLGSLQQQGADRYPFFDVDKAYYGLENKIVRAKEPAKERTLQ